MSSSQEQAPAALAHAFEGQRGRLMGVAYRMLGSVSLAEDTVQESWLRLCTAHEPPRALGAWLVTTVTRLCLDELKSARSQRLSYVGPWLPDPWVGHTEGAPVEALERAQTLSTSFMLLLETLGPVERAVFVLREVFDCPFEEIAEAVGKSEVACRQLLSRARQRIGGLDGAAASSDYADVAKTQAFLHAVLGADLAAVKALLIEDVRLLSDGGGKASAARRPLCGPDAVARFLIGITQRATSTTTAELVWVNGVPGLVLTEAGKVIGTFAFEWRGGRLAAIYAARNPDKLTHLNRG